MKKHAIFALVTALLLPPCAVLWRDRAGRASLDLATDALVVAAGAAATWALFARHRRGVPAAVLVFLAVAFAGGVATALFATLAIAAVAWGEAS